MNEPQMSPARIAILTALALLAAGSTGCQQVRALHRPDPRLTPTAAVSQIANPVLPEFKPVEGSLWPGQGGTHWFVDDKAFRRGDILLVSVTSNNQGSKDATTETSREASISATIKRFLGLEDRIQNIAKPDKNSPNDAELLNAESKNSFKGAGKTERKDDLKATISAVVTDVLGNGNLVVYGHQIVQVNSEASVLTVQGIVRPSDISEDNRIDSTRIANARIEFDGSGVVTDKQQPGLAMRAFDWVWPF